MLSDELEATEAVSLFFGRPARESNRTEAFFGPPSSPLIPNLDHALERALYKLCRIRTRNCFGDRVDVVGYSISPALSLSHGLG